MIDGVDHIHPLRVVADRAIFIIGSGVSRSGQARLSLCGRLWGVETFTERVTDAPPLSSLSTFQRRRQPQFCPRRVRAQLSKATAGHCYP